MGSAAGASSTGDSSMDDSSMGASSEGVTGSFAKYRVTVSLENHDFATLRSLSVQSDDSWQFSVPRTSSTLQPASRTFSQAAEMVSPLTSTSWSSSSDEHDARAAIRASAEMPVAIFLIILKNP